MNQYKIFEDEFETLHMFAWNPAGEIIYASQDISASTKETLNEIIKAVEDMEEEGWDGATLCIDNKPGRVEWRTKYYNAVIANKNSRLVADNEGIYKDLMRLRARKVFGLQ